MSNQASPCLHVHGLTETMVRGRGTLPSASLVGGAMLMTVHCHVHVYIVPAMLTVLHVFYPLQEGNTPLHFAAKGGHITCLERLLSAPGIDVNIMDGVSSIC